MLLSVEDINFAYREGDRLILQNISTSFKQGDFTAIIGPNGSGKTTLIKILANLLKPTNGKVCLDKTEFRKITRKNLAKVISYVPQNISSVYPFSVFEIIMMGRTPRLNFYGTYSAVDIEIVNARMDELNILHLRDKSVNELSGGELQRVFIARALVQEPKILLLDEPSSHLDIKHQIQIFKLLAKKNVEENLTVIVISHDLNMVGYYAKRGILLNDGKIILDDVINKVISEESIKDVFGLKSEVRKINDTEKISVKIIPS